MVELTTILCGTFEVPEAPTKTRRHSCMAESKKEERDQSKKEEQITLEVLRFLRSFRGRGFSPAEIAINISTKTSTFVLGRILNDMADEDFLIRYLPTAKAKKYLYKFNGGEK
jgi:hypothetical protein